MRYAPWMPQSLMQWTLYGSAAALLVISCTVAALTVRYGPESVRAAKNMLVHADGLVGEARLAAKESVTASKDTDAAMKHLDGVVQNVGTLVTEARGTVRGATAAEANLGQLASNLSQTSVALTRRIDALASTQAAADEAIRQIATVPGAIATALQPLPALQLSLTRTSTAAGDFIGGPASAAATNSATLTGNLAVATDHFDARWLAPYSGKHPRWHKVWGITSGMIGLGSRGAEGAYYGIQIVK